MKKLKIGNDGSTSLSPNMNGTCDPIQAETPRSKQRRDIRQKRLQYFDSPQHSVSSRR